MADTNYKAIAVPTRILLHPNEPLQIGGDWLRRAAESATDMRRNTTQGQAWRDARDVSEIANQSELRVDTYIATTEGFTSTLAMREDGVMLLSDVDDATAGFLVHLAKTLQTTFSLAATPPGTGASILRESRQATILAMKKGPFQDSYHWSNIAHVNDAPGVVKRHKVKTGEIAPEEDKKAEAKAKKAAATKDRAAAAGES